MRKRLALLTLIDLAVGGAAVTAVTSPAGAQGAPSPSWTGFYIGGHAGWRGAEADFVSRPYNVTVGFDTIPLPGFFNSFSPDGIIGGAHAGYNFQFAPNWLFGFEGDWSFGRQGESASNTVTGLDSAGDAFTFRRNVEFLLQSQATIRARTGYIVDTWLWYVTGGVAFAEVKWTDQSVLNKTFPTATVSALVITEKWLTGWVGGVGVEKMVAPNWTWRVEYLFESFGDIDVSHGFGPQIGTLDLNAVHKLRVGVTYKN